MKSPSKTVLAVGVTAAVLMTAFGYVYSTSMLKRNLGELTQLSEYILMGQVIALSDGFAGNVPYTEVTIQVAESLKGGQTGTYTFRQFGLLKPRDMGDGRTFVGVSPPGWPRFQQGEKVIVFLYKSAARTGLRTTVGLLQGKFNLVDGQVVNAVDNLGLFQNLKVPATQLTKAEEAMLRVQRGPVDAATFVSFVKKAVQQQWFK